MDKQQNIEARPGDAERPQESGVASPGRGGRMSRQRKTAAVRETYNTTWLIERHGYLTPTEFRDKHLQPFASVA